MRNTKKRTITKYDYKATNSFKSLINKSVDEHPICPYCGGKMKYRTAEGIFYKNAEKMLFVCENYPSCDCYAKTKKGSNDKIYMAGTPANYRLRALRTEAHFYFDKLTEVGIFSDKATAYYWITNTVVVGPNIGMKHIGEFNDYYCQRTIEESIKVLYNNKEKSKGKISLYHSARYCYSEKIQDLVNMINEMS